MLKLITNGRAYALFSIILLFACKAIVGFNSDGQVVFFLCLFLVLKPLVGFKSWWHAIGAAAMASALFIIYHAMVPPTRAEHASATHGVTGVYAGQLPQEALQVLHSGTGQAQVPDVKPFGLFLERRRS